MRADKGFLIQGTPGNPLQLEAEVDAAPQKSNAKYWIVGGLVVLGVVLGVHFHNNKTTPAPTPSVVGGASEELIATTVLTSSSTVAKIPSDGGYIYASAADALKACEAADYSRLCTQAEVTVHAAGLTWTEQCRSGWTSSGTAGYYMTSIPAGVGGCGSVAQRWNSYLNSGKAGAWCCNSLPPPAPTPPPPTPSGICPNPVCCKTINDVWYTSCDNFPVYSALQHCTGQTSSRPEYTYTYTDVGRGDCANGVSLGSERIGTAAGCWSWCNSDSRCSAVGYRKASNDCYKYQGSITTGDNSGAAMCYSLTTNDDTAGECRPSSNSIGSSRQNTLAECRAWAIGKGGSYAEFTLDHTDCYAFSGSVSGDSQDDTICYVKHNDGYTTRTYHNVVAHHGFCTGGSECPGIQGCNAGVLSAPYAPRWCDCNNPDYDKPLSAGYHWVAGADGTLVLVYFN